MECKGLEHIELRRKKIELIQRCLPPSDERDKVIAQVNAGNVETVGHVKGEFSFMLIIRYYSGGESIFNL